MPSPAEEPAFKSQGTDLPQGSTSQLAEGLDIARDAEGNEVDVASYSGYAQFSEVDDEYDEFATQPSWFPERPITHGAPFGPGLNSVVTPPRDEDAVLDDLATEAIRTGGTESLRIWAVRRLAGE